MQSTLAIFAALAAALPAQAESAPAALPSIAVMEFDGIPQGDKDQASLAQTLTEALSTELLATKKFKLVERRHIAKVLKELALAQSGAVDEQNAAKVGNMLGAKFLLVGSISRVGGKQLVQAREIDVETAAAANAQSVSFSELDDLPAAAKDLAKRFASGADAGSQSGFADYDAKAMREVARGVARQLAQKFPVVKGKLVSVLPNGKAGCSVSPGAYKGELFDVVAFDNFTEAKKHVGHARIDSLDGKSCQASYRSQGGPLDDGAEITSLPTDLQLAEVKPDPAAQAPVADALKSALSEELAGSGPFKMVSAEPSLVVKGVLTGRRGARKVDVQVFDHDGTLVGAASASGNF